MPDLVKMEEGRTGGRFTRKEVDAIAKAREDDRLHEGSVVEMEKC
jgi:hypothetical protein